MRSCWCTGNSFYVEWPRRRLIHCSSTALPKAHNHHHHSSLSAHNLVSSATRTLVRSTSNLPSVPLRVSSSFTFDPSAPSTSFARSHIALPLTDCVKGGCLRDILSALLLPTSAGRGLCLNELYSGECLRFYIYSSPSGCSVAIFFDKHHEEFHTVRIQPHLLVDRQQHVAQLQPPGQRRWALL